MLSVAACGLKHGWEGDAQLIGLITSVKTDPRGVLQRATDLVTLSVHRNQRLQRVCQTDRR